MRVNHLDLTWLVYIIETSRYEHRGMTWLKYITDTSRNKHQGTIHKIYEWIHSEVTNTSTFFTLGISAKHLSLFPFKYFFLNAFFHQALFPKTICQTIFAPNGRFIATRFWIHVPPLPFGLHTISQLTKWNLFVPLGSPPFPEEVSNLFFNVLDYRIGS